MVNKKKLNRAAADPPASVLDDAAVAQLRADAEALLARAAPSAATPPVDALLHELRGQLCAGASSPPDAQTLEPRPTHGDAAAGSHVTLTDISARKQSEERHRLSQERLELALDAASEGLWDWDLRSGLVVRSQRYYEIVGRVPNAGTADFAFFKSTVHPEDLPRVLELIAAHRQGRTTQMEFEYRLASPPGTLRWMGVRGRAVERDAEGQALRMVGTITDVTPRKQAEERLMVSQAQLKSFIRCAPISIAMFDRDMTYLANSDRWLLEYGRGFDDLTGRSHYEVHPDIPDQWKDGHRQALAGATLRNDEDSWTQADGSRYWLRWVVQPWTDEQGGIGGIIITAEDITARKAVELALREQEAQYRAIIEAAADGVWVVDELGRFLIVNEAYARRSGYSREELLGMRIADVEAVESAEDIRVHIDKVRAVGNDLFETLHRAKSGEIWPAEVNATYSAAGGGQFFGFLRDNTERKRNEAAVRALRAEMEQVARFQIASQTVAAIAHELNQPLNAVVTYSETAIRLLQAGNPRPERLLHALEGTAQQAQRAGQVVHELMAFLHQGEVVTEPVDLNGALRTALARIELNGRTCRTQLALDPDLAPVRANRVQIEKVLINLIQNGIEAMHEHGVSQKSIVVTLTTSADGAMAQVTVRDNGPGLDDRMLLRIFDPFFTTKSGGLGMGLAISRAIIEAHGGQLWVESVHGAGASFHFTLPFAA